MTALPPPTAGPVTQLLAEIRSGGRGAFDRLFAYVYDELLVLARRQLRYESPDRSLEVTGLVHELYLKLLGQSQLDIESRAHFFGIAARAMRQITVDLARRRNADKRGGGWARITLSGADIPEGSRPDELLALDEALERLEPRQRQVVEYRFFAGLKDEEIAEILGVSTRTVQREWMKARAWLYRNLYNGTQDGPDGSPPTS